LGRTGGGAGRFYSGVIEGFYNRPWTRNQRLDLFKKMNKYKLNSYLYAPKDDLKHRSEWRTLYTEAECAELKHLITACSENNVIFFYGISPGLDIVYSSKEEWACLHAKTKQIQDLGCTGFAILWDDIEPELSKEDAAHFDTFGHAHCEISNRLYEALDQPEFLFCPVEYCSSRSVPTVQESPYLKAIGSILQPAIRMLWTGSKVVSKQISVKEIRELAKVINRKPIIWDNLHANDYDLQRLYLGPYIGRDRSIPPEDYLSGSMTNPNCEYSLNLPAIVTLADWVHNPDWEPSGLASHKLAVREMLAESRLPGPEEDPTAARASRKGKTKESSLTEEDFDLLFQTFWLPHSHGPKIEKLLKDFAYCKDNAAVMIGWKKFQPGEQPDQIDDWIDRASYVNTVCKQFFLVCDKLTHVANRDLLFDLSGYLNNVRTLLNGCNSYLKWIGIHECKKPIRGGPTLAGLPGGLAGDLMRLYPVQSNDMYPLKRMVTAAENVLMILPAKNPTKLLDELRSVAGAHGDFEAYAAHVKAADQVLVVKQKAAASVNIVGFLVTWRPKVVKVEDNKSPLSTICQLFRSEERVVKSYEYYAKIYFKDLYRFLDADLLEQMLGAVVEEGEGVVIGVEQSCPALTRFLSLAGFSELKSDLSIAGCDLLEKVF